MNVESPRNDRNNKAKNTSATGVDATINHAFHERFAGQWNTCMDRRTTDDHQRLHRRGRPTLLGPNYVNVAAVLNHVAERDLEYATTDYVLDGWTHGRYYVDRYNVTALVAKDLPQTPFIPWARQHLSDAEQAPLMTCLHNTGDANLRCSGRTAAWMLRSVHYSVKKPFSDYERCVIALVKAHSLPREVFDHFTYPWRGLREVKASRKLTQPGTPSSERRR